MKLLRNSHGICLLVILSSIICILVLLFVGSSYGVNDDFFISAISNGVYGHEYSHCLIYSSSLLGWIIRIINRFNNSLNWYVLIQYLLLTITCALFASIISKKTNNILCGCISLFLFWAIICLDVVTKISFKTTAGITAIIGLLSLFTFADERNALLCLLSTIVCYFGFLYRASAFLLICPFAAFYFIYSIIKAKNRLCYIKYVMVYLSLLFVCVFLSITVDSITYKSQEWRDYKDTITYKTKFLDYPNNLGDVYKEIDSNLSKNDIHMLLMWKSDDAAKYSTSNLKMLYEKTDHVYNTDIQSLLKQLFAFYLKTFKLYQVLCLLSITVMMLILNHQLIKELLAIFILTSCVVVGLCFLGRFPTTISYVLFSSVLAIISIIMVESVHPKNISLVIYCVVSVFILLLISIFQIKKENNSFDIFEYTKFNNKDLFVVDILLLHDDYFSRYSPIVNIDGNLMDNTFVLGGWPCPSPLSLNVCKKTGCKNSLEIIAKKSNAYLITINDEYNLKVVEKYLQENYDDNKHIECDYLNDNGTKICKFVSN